MSPRSLLLLLSAFLSAWITAATAQPASPPVAPSDKQQAVEQPRSSFSNDAAIGFVGTLIGAGIGALVSLIVVPITIRAQERHAARQRKADAKLARRVVTSEIDHNLDMMAAYMREIDLDNPVRIAGNHTGWEWTASHPPPTWSRVAFEGSFRNLPDALTEDEFLATFAFFARLERYTQAAKMAADSYARGAPHDAMSAAFFVANQIAEEIVAKGNPLERKRKAKGA